MSLQINMKVFIMRNDKKTYFGYVLMFLGIVRMTELGMSWLSLMYNLT